MTLTGADALKRIFKEFSDGTLALPEPELAEPQVLETEEEFRLQLVHLWSITLESFVSTGQIISDGSKFLPPFSDPSSQLPSGSIKHFLIARPVPPTETLLAPLCITPADFILQSSSKRELHWLIITQRGQL